MIYLVPEILDDNSIVVYGVLPPFIEAGRGLPSPFLAIPRRGRGQVVGLFAEDGGEFGVCTVQELDNWVGVAGCGGEGEDRVRRGGDGVGIGVFRPPVWPLEVWDAHQIASI